MFVTIKFAIKNINLELLREELVAVSVPVQGLLMAGFHRLNARVYEPNAATQVIARASGRPDVTAEPGELKFKNDPALTLDEEVALDAVLSAHDATNLSAGQRNDDTDSAAIPALVNAFRNWDTRTPAQKDNILRQLTRLVARLLDSSQNM